MEGSCYGGGGGGDGAEITLYSKTPRLRTCIFPSRPKQVLAYMVISNGNRTDWSQIQSVIIRVINKIPICLITSMISIGNSMICSDIRHKYHE